MTEYQGIVLLKLLGPIVILFVITAVYFIYNKDQTVWNRLLASSHSSIAIIAAIYAIVVSKFTSQTSFDPHTLNISKILAISVMIAFVAVLYFKGNKKVHLLLLPFVLCLAYIWHVGGKAIMHTLV